MGKMFKKHNSKCWWWIKREVKGEAAGKGMCLKRFPGFSFESLVATLTTQL